VIAERVGPECPASNSNRRAERHRPGGNPDRTQENAAAGRYSHYARARHHPRDEKPEEFVRIVDEFLKRVPALRWVVRRVAWALVSSRRAGTANIIGST
jgi:hypothetical protein